MHKKLRETAIDAAHKELTFCAKALRCRIGPANLKVPEQHVGPAYEKEIELFTATVAHVRREFMPMITNLGNAITRIHYGPDWRKDDQIVALWYGAAHILRWLSDHPTKKVAVVIVDKNNRLQSWGVNRLTHGLRRKGSHYIKGDRKNFIMCGERTALSKLHQFTGLKARRGKFKHDMMNINGIWISPLDFMNGGQGPTDDDIRQTVRNMTATLTYWGQETDVLHESRLIGTCMPCLTCADPIIAHRPKEVIVHMGAGSMFTRRDKLQASYDKMTNAGIQITDASQFPMLIV